MLLSWITKRAINGYLKDLLKQIEKKDLKQKVIDCINDYKDDIVEKVRDIISAEVQKIVTKVIKKFQDKI